MAETVGAIISLAWLIVLALLLLLCVLVGIACLFLKGEAKNVAINILLGTATLALVFGAGGSYAVGSISAKTDSTTGKAEETELVQEADYYGYDLTDAEYVDSLNPFWKGVAQSGGGMTRAQALKLTEAELRKTFENHRDSAGLAMRLALVVHEAGGNVTGVLDSAKVKASEKLLTDARALLDTGITADGVRRTAASKAIIEVLPDGWYRRTAMKIALRGPLAAGWKPAIPNNSGALNWTNKFIPHAILSLVLSLVGIAGMFVIFKRRGASESTPPVKLTFRQTYGTGLAVVYVELLLALAAGWTWDLFGTAPIMDPTSGLMRSTIVVVTGSAIGLATAVAMVYFLICRPQGITFLKFWNSADKDDPARTFLDRHFILMSLIGFCIALFLETLVAALRWIVGAQPFINDASNWELVLALISGNAVMVSLAVLAVVVIAPVLEELVVRGLIYRWMRGKWGVRVGVVLSSLLFAAMHMDFQGFWEYFSAGIVLALMYERTKNLTVSTLVHALWNAWACFTSTFLFPH